MDARNRDGDAGVDQWSAAMHRAARTRRHGHQLRSDGHVPPDAGAPDQLGHNPNRQHAVNSALGRDTNIVGMVTNIWKSGRCDEWALDAAPDFPMLPYLGMLAPVF